MAAQQMTLPLAPRRPRRILRVAIDSECPVDHVPQGMGLTVLCAKTFYSVRLDVGVPSRDGFYGLVASAETGDYRAIAWYETKTGIWWDVGCRKPFNMEGMTYWYGLTAELGGRERRRVLEPSGLVMTFYPDRLPGKTEEPVKGSRSRRRLVEGSMPLPQAPW